MTNVIIENNAECTTNTAQLATCKMAGAVAKNGNSKGKNYFYLGENLTSSYIFK